MVSTVTLYRSPVRLVNHAAEEAEPYSSQAIARARKKMMAEIALGGEEITIEDVSYSRNDASGLLDFVTEESWKAHCIIYANKGLLHFLEQEEFNNEELKKADAYLYNERFVQSVSPYFAHAFNSVSGKLIRQNKFEELVLLLNYQGYILPEHSHEAYQKLRTYLDELNYTLRNLSWEKFIADESVLHFIFSDAWKQAINKLPSSFTSMRDELVEQLINIVLRFQHKATWYYLHQVLVQLKAVETNDFNRSEVVRIDEVIYKNTKVEGGKSTKKDGEFSTGRIIWWAIWIILMIVRVSTCNDKSNNTSFDFDRNKFRAYESNRKLEKRNEPLFLNFIDSLSQVRSLPLTKEQLQMKTGSQPFTSFAEDFPAWGRDSIIIRNNSNYHCVVLYIDGPSKPGSVYEGALPNINAVYIQRDDNYRFAYTPGKGKFYFVFGDKWGPLKKQAELPVYSDWNAFKEERQQPLFVYEFFSNKKPLKQKYLHQALFIEDNFVTRDEATYTYLNDHDKQTSEEKTTITLLTKNNQLAVEAKGKLVVKEEKSDETECFSDVLENSGIESKKYE